MFTIPTSQNDWNPIKSNIKPLLIHPSIKISRNEGAPHVLCPFQQVFSHITGISLELSDREKFCDIFRISGRSFGPNFGFPYMFYTFWNSPSAQKRVTSASVVTLCLPNRPLGWALKSGRMSVSDCELYEYCFRWHWNRHGISVSTEMSNVTRKPVFGVCEQGRLKLACAATEAR